MAKLELSLDTLGDLADGVVRKMIDRELRRAVEDFSDRAAEDGKPRGVDIHVEIGHAKGRTYVDVQAAAKIPKLRSPATEIRITADENGEVAAYYQEMSPENVEQPNFPQLDPETKRRAE